MFTCFSRPKFLLDIVCNDLCDQHTVKPRLSAEVCQLSRQSVELRRCRETSLKQPAEL